MLKALLILMLGLSGPEVAVTVPTGLFGVINDAQNETIRTQRESLWCMIGEDNGTDIFVSHIVKPEQETYVGWKIVNQSFMFISEIIQKEPCPAGTIGDLHTHPWHEDPSKFDYESWIVAAALPEGENYRFYGVSSKVPDNKLNQVRFFVVEGTSVFEIGRVDKTRVIIGPQT